MLKNQLFQTCYTAQPNHTHNRFNTYYVPRTQSHDSAIPQAIKAHPQGEYNGFNKGQAQQF